MAKQAKKTEKTKKAKKSSQPRTSVDDPSLPMANPRSAGVDVYSREHWVCVTSASAMARPTGASDGVPRGSHAEVRRRVRASGDGGVRGDVPHQANEELGKEGGRDGLQTDTDDGRPAAGELMHEPRSRPSEKRPNGNNSNRAPNGRPIGGGGLDALRATTNAKMQLKCEKPKQTLPWGGPSAKYALPVEAGVPANRTSLS